MIYSSSILIQIDQQHIRQVLQRLLEHQLYVKAEKSKVHASSVSFWGFIVSEGTVSMDPEKACAVQELPTPISRKQL